VQDTKFVVVTGGVLSGLGKGVATASIGRLLYGKKIITIKCDGYLNVDPGTMNPIEHGEVFVLDDGGEVDMDFGHYERFIGVRCKSDWNLTSGKIFSKVIAKEREGKYLGKTIQIFPHVVNEVLAWWDDLIAREQPEVVLIEIGGTIGDIENSWYVEAARLLRKRVGDSNIAFVHLTYVPFLDSVGEAKTKPAQRDVALLHEKGIWPDILIPRCKRILPQKIKEKLALFCDVDVKDVISGVDVDTVYDIPLMFKKEGMLERLKSKLHIDVSGDLSVWESLVARIKSPKNELTIAVCGKYTELKDSYASIAEALTHAGAHFDSHVSLIWVETSDIESGKLKLEDALKGVDAVLIPGGFGSRGVEGKIQIIKYVRENKIPFLGICYGLQLAVIEFARNVCNLAGANTTENDSVAKYPVIDFMPEQRAIKEKGGTMRLGSCEAVLKNDSLVSSLYGSSVASERHRHRYEVNPEFHKILLDKGLVFSGTSKDGRLVEFIELKDHPFFVATQAHNELTSRLEKPNPLFFGFVKSALDRHLHSKL